MGGDRRVVLIREMTKLHEEAWRGRLAVAAEHAVAVEPRGEYVVVLEGSAPPMPAGDEELTAAVAERLAAGVSTRDAVAEVASAFGVPRRRVYALAIRR